MGYLNLLMMLSVLVDTCVVYCGAFLGVGLSLCGLVCGFW